MEGPTRSMDWADHGEALGHRRKALTVAAGGERLGCSLYEVAPGRKAWPYHYHLTNGEAIHVLEGSVKLGTPDGR